VRRPGLAGQQDGQHDDTDQQHLRLLQGFEQARLRLRRRRVRGLGRFGSGDDGIG
jgi:hypothetical protein